ncbi:putative nuclease HARBI1 [Cardiocondyla obscurior]|uniref:putative nuclease HARBI1 n=1 Tax=Cardiocondyla obscurior TaxID=286306 RepID=UPI0039656738
MAYMEELDDVEFKMRFRLQKETVLLLCQEIEHLLTFPTMKNNPISSLNQVLLTLRFLATGSFYITIGDFIGVSTVTAHRIMSKVIKAIAGLRPHYIKFPSTAAEIRRERERFYRIAKFPKVIGCVDCTHIRVQSFGGPDAEIYRNRKGYFSLNVQAVTNANLEITDIVTRWQGSAHDSTIFNNSRLCANFEARRYGDAILLGDSGYPLKPYLLTPILYSRNRAEQRYNEAHIRTRNTIERLFGVWKRRFSILSLGMRYSLERTMTTIVAAAVLHNIERRNADELPPCDPDLNMPQWNNNIECNACAENPRTQNSLVRDNIINNYFSN